MGQSPPTVKTTDQPKADGRGLSPPITHKFTVRAARVACLDNLAALKSPMPKHGKVQYSQL